MAGKDPNTASFAVDVIGEVTGEHFPGLFTAKKRLSFKDQLNRDRIRRELLGDAKGPALARAESLSDLLSEVAVRLTDAPSWWKLRENGLLCEDDNVLTAVADGAIAVAVDAAKELKDRAEKAKADLLGTITDETK